MHWNFSLYPTNKFIICHHCQSHGWFRFSQSHSCVGSLQIIAHIVPWMNHVILLSKDLQNFPLKKNHFFISVGKALQLLFRSCSQVFIFQPQWSPFCAWRYQVCSLVLCFRVFLIFGLITPSVLVRTLVKQYTDWYVCIMKAYYGTHMKARKS